MSREYVIVVTQDADSQPIEHRVSALPISIGRDAANDVQVASQFVSGFHAKLEEIKGRVFVRDLGSRNGTQVPAADGSKTRLAAHALFDLSQSRNEFFLGSSVRVQVVDPTHGAVPWRRGSGPRRAPDSFMDAPPRGGQGGFALPDIEPPGGAWPRAPEPEPADFGNGPLSLPPLPGEGRGGRPPEPRGMPPEPPPVVRGGYDDGGRRFDPVPPPPVRGFDPAPPPPVRGFEPMGGGYGSPLGAGPPQLATGNFQLSIEGLALQGLRELAASLLPGQTLETQGDVARLITRLHDAIDVLCRSLVPLRQGYLKFLSRMELQGGGLNTPLDVARDPSAVAAALLDFREGAPDASKALEQALSELATHQVALLDGVMQGIRALLDDLSPSAIDDAAENKRGGLRIGGRQKEAWDEYCERYERLSEQSETFARVFGPEFADAYRRYRRR